LHLEIGVAENCAKRIVWAQCDSAVKRQLQRTLLLPDDLNVFSSLTQAKMMILDLESNRKNNRNLCPILGLRPLRGSSQLLELFDQAIVEQKSPTTALNHSATSPWISSLRSADAKCLVNSFGQSDLPFRGDGGDFVND